MRLRFAELKKTITRRAGEPYITPHLLRPREATDALDAVIALHEAWLGRTRATFPDDRPLELIGDYRLARCLLSTLSEWYEWRAALWPGTASAAEAAALAARDLTTPGALRLALYDYAHVAYGGYLPATEREAALDDFAAALDLRRATLDALLALDDERTACLWRVAEAAPSAWELAARYNQRAIEAMLANASSVEWRLTAEAAAGFGGGLGAVVKRVCFLARRMGVQYELAFDAWEQPEGAEEAAPEPPALAELARVAERPMPYVAGAALGGQAALATLDNTARPLIITLYGPQEVMGAPNHYGERLARLCRALLGYRRATPRDTPRDRASEALASRATFAGAGLRGSARVYLHGRPLTFLLEPTLLRLTQGADAPRIGTDGDGDTLGDTLGDTQASQGADAFDSGLERHLHEEFAALERAGEAHGWRLEREPEPALAGETILVPDFALTRGRQRVYLEIAGYWRPGYRERKARKLAALRGRVALVVAAPTSARAEFGAFTADYPLLWYSGERVSAQALLALIERTYDDLPERLASLDRARIRAEVALRGRIPPTESYALLRCYTRNELATALDYLRGAAGDSGATGEALDWLDGVGLCAVEWRAMMSARLRAAVLAAPERRLTLETLTRQLDATHAPGAQLGEAAVETLAALAGLRIARPSIFETLVLAEGAPGDAGATAGAADTAADTATAAAQPGRPRRPAQPRHSVRRTSPQRASYTTASFFSDEQAGEQVEEQAQADEPAHAPTAAMPDADGA